MSAGTMSGLIEIIAALLPFIILLIFFILYLSFRTWIRNREKDLRNHFNQLRKTQNRLQDLTAETEIYSESDPDPYGMIIKQVNLNLTLCSQLTQELNHLYVNNRSLLKKLSKPERKDLRDLVNIWRGLNQGLDRFDAVATRQVQITLVVEKNISRLKNIANDVGEKSKKILELISVSKSKQKELIDLSLTDDELVKVSQSLSEWEQMALQHIPVAFIAGDRGANEQENDRIFVAKIFRLLSRIEPEVRILGSQIVEWRSNYDRIQSLRKDIATIHHNTSELMMKLSQGDGLMVEWGLLDQQQNELLEKINQGEKTVSVSQLDSLLEKLEDLKEEQDNLNSHVHKIQQFHTELLERLKKRQQFHQKEWVKNSLRMMGEAKEFNRRNWPGIQVDKLYSRLQDLLDSLTKITPLEIPGSIEAASIERYLKTIQKNEKEFQLTSSAFTQYFEVLQEIRKLEEELKSSLNQFSSSLNQLVDLVSSNPSLKKTVKDNLLKYIRRIEEINADVTDRTQGTVKQKSKQWGEVSSKIIQAINKLRLKLVDENGTLIVKLRTQVDAIQDFLAFNEPVFYGALTYLKDHEKQDAQIISSSKFRDGDLSILELVHKIRDENETWQRLTASTNALEEVSGPIIECLVKLEANRHELTTLMKEAEEKVPENLSWPPTTKKITTEKTKANTLDQVYLQLKKNRKTAIQLVAAAGDLNDQYKLLIANLQKSIDEADTEQKRFDELDKRLVKSIDLWMKLAKSHKDNLLLEDNIQELLTSIQRDYSELKKRYLDGRINYSQAYQMFRIICRRIDQESVEFDDNNLIDISGEIQHRL